MSDHCPGKSSWPELVGVQGEVAEKIVEKENPNVDDAVIVPKGSVVTADFRCDRVRIWVNKHDTVYEVPKIG